MVFPLFNNEWKSMISVALGINFKICFQYYKQKIISHCCFNLRKAALMVSPLLALYKEGWKYHYDDTFPQVTRRLAAFSDFLSLKFSPWNVLKVTTFFCGPLSKYLPTKTIIHKVVRHGNEIQTSHLESQDMSARGLSWQVTLWNAVPVPRIWKLPFIAILV